MKSKLKLPKSVYLKAKKLTKKYQVNIHSKKYNKNIHVGYYDTIEEAVIARDKFALENYHDLTSGYLPRGMTKRKNGFVIFFEFKGQKEYLGVYDNIEDAVNFRHEYINSLK